MLIFTGMLLVGVVLLYFGAEWLVRGSVGLARAMGVRPLVIGLTVVAYGTSAPELVVSVVAATEGKSAIALGNVIGSNVANLGLILGLSALISPPRVDRQLVLREIPVLLASALLLPVLLYDGVISRVDGAGLVIGVAAFTWFTLANAKKLPAAAPILQEVREEVEAEAAHGKPSTLTLIAGVGLFGLVLGGKLFVDGATGFARALGMSERLVGLTIVAVGTSLPEMAASVVAALRGHSALAIGNIVGSNIFNILLILGGASVIAPIEGSLSSIAVDTALLLGLTAVAAMMMFGDRRISRLEGSILMVCYAAFIVIAVAT
ncbi:MAG TPA: calcium/sodium antiporter [Polyangiaceae bacterium]|jgi:cation:H+ antiporter|nr:calcium/sodium antiporter [Polyangiaceae bacterium]